MSDSIRVKKEQNCCFIHLNRPDKKNALNQEMIGELLRQLQELRQTSIRVLVLSAVGNVFCAGADLHDMVKMIDEKPEKNYDQAMQLAVLLDTLDNLPIFTIAKVNGPAFGGGLGLLCCCDLVFAEQNACFSFSELKLGLVPATIMPYILKTIGLRQARRYILNTELFDAQEALKIGLVHQLAAKNELEELINKQIRLLTKTKQQAFVLAKQLLLKSDQLTEQQIRVSAHQLAQIRTQREAVNGIREFLHRAENNVSGTG